MHFVASDLYFVEPDLHFVTFDLCFVIPDLCFVIPDLCFVATDLRFVEPDVHFVEPDVHCHRPDLHFIALDLYYSKSEASTHLRRLFIISLGWCKRHARTENKNKPRRHEQDARASIGVNYWRVIVLQLSKLYIERERYNIIKLLEKCKTGNYYASLNINQNFIIKELNRIEEQQKLIYDIKLQRDKIFAHEDANNENIVSEITLDETKDLIELCQNIIFHIYSEVFDAHYDFEMGNSAIDNLKYVLKSLDEREKQREKEEEQFINEFISRNNKNK